MNVTVTESSGSGFISVYPCDSARPVVSSLNYGPGQTVPNLVTVDAGTTLEVCFFASATTHLLADLAGYYVDGAGDGFTPSAPVRMFDTRKTTKLAAGSVFEFDLSPYVASDASAAAFNLTATEVQGSGYITAYPCGTPPPLASNLNVSAGQTVPNLVTVALPANKHVCFFTLTGTHLLADLTGWYAPSAASGFVSITPTRWIDTRDDSDTPLPAGLVNEIFFGPYFPDATAMVFNATVTEPDDRRLPHRLSMFTKPADRLERQLRGRTDGAQPGDLGGRLRRQRLPVQLDSAALDRRCRRLLHRRTRVRRLLPRRHRHPVARRSQEFFPESQRT